MEKNSNEKSAERNAARKNYRRQLKKRPAQKPILRPNDIYITTKSNFKAQQKQCEDLLNSGVREIYLHCLGNAITRGINLALHLINNSNNTLSYAINTSTIDLTDELHPLNDNEDLTLQKRKNSAIHIKIFLNNLYDFDLTE